MHSGAVDYGEWDDSLTPEGKRSFKADYNAHVTRQADFDADEQTLSDAISDALAETKRLEGDSTTSGGVALLERTKTAERADKTTKSFDNFEIVDGELSPEQDKLLENRLLEDWNEGKIADDATIRDEGLRIVAWDDINADIAGDSEYCQKSDIIKISPSCSYDENARPKGKPTRIYPKMDATTRRSDTRENESAIVLAQQGYDIEQNPKVEGTSKKPDYRIEGVIFDCCSPEPGTKIRNVCSRIKEKIEKNQAYNIVLNLDDWEGSIEGLVDNLNEYRIEKLEEVIVVKNGRVISIYP